MMCGFFFNAGPPPGDSKPEPEEKKKAGKKGLGPRQVAGFLNDQTAPLYRWLKEEGADLDVIVTCIVSSACCLAFEMTGSKEKARDLLFKAVEDSLVVMEFKEGKKTKT